MTLVCFNIFSVVIFTTYYKPSIFVRSGNFLLGSGKLRNFGASGYGWSSWPHSNGVYAYYLSFGDSGVYPLDVNERWIGFPLRCLANYDICSIKI